MQFLVLVLLAASWLSNTDAQQHAGHRHQALRLEGSHQRFGKRNASQDEVFTSISGAESPLNAVASLLDSLIDDITTQPAAPLYSAQGSSPSQALASVTSPTGQSGSEAYTTPTATNSGEYAPAKSVNSYTTTSPLADNVNGVVTPQSSNPVPSQQTSSIGNSPSSESPVSTTVQSTSVQTPSASPSTFEDPATMFPTPVAPSTPLSLSSAVESSTTAESVWPSQVYDSPAVLPESTVASPSTETASSAPTDLDLSNPSPLPAVEPTRSQETTIFVAAPSGSNKSGSPGVNVATDSTAAQSPVAPAPTTDLSSSTSAADHTNDGTYLGLAPSPTDTTGDQFPRPTQLPDTTSSESISGANTVPTTSLRDTVSNPALGASSSASGTGYDTNYFSLLPLTPVGSFSTQPSVTVDPAGLSVSPIPTNNLDTTSVPSGTDVTQYGSQPSTSAGTSVSDQSPTQSAVPDDRHSGGASPQTFGIVSSPQSTTPATMPTSTFTADAPTINSSVSDPGSATNSSISGKNGLGSDQTESYPTTSLGDTSGILPEPTHVPVQSQNATSANATTESSNEGASLSGASSQSSDGLLSANETTVPATPVSTIPSSTPGSSIPAPPATSSATSTSQTMVLPAMILTQPVTSQPPPTSTSIASGSITPEATIVPLLPAAIAPAGGIVMPNSSQTIVQIGFDEALNYPFVVSSALSTAQIFAYLPRAVSAALNVSSSDVISNSLRAYPRTGYNATVAYLVIPNTRLSDLQRLWSTSGSALYEQADASVQSLVTLIDSEIPLYLPSTKGASSGQGSGSAASSSSSTSSSANKDTASYGSLAETGPSSSTTTKSVTKIAGIGVGAAAAAGAYATVMFALTRRYRNRRNPRFSRLSGNSGVAAGITSRFARKEVPISGPMNPENSLGI